MKIAVVMSGGSAKGSIELGCLRGLKDQGKLEGVTEFYGVSVGALNATGMAKIGLERLEKVWDNVKKFSDILKFNWLTLGPLFGYGTFNTKPLRKLLEPIVNEEQNLARATVAYVDTFTGKLVHARSDEMHPDQFADAVESSAIQPVIMTAKHGKFVDGGVREVTPLKQAIMDGADKIIIILASPWDEDPAPWEMPKVVWYKPWTWVMRSMALLMRTIDILVHEVFVHDIKSCLSKNGDPRYKNVEIEIYAPWDHSVSSFGFNQENIQKGIKQGLEMAKRGPVKKS